MQRIAARQARHPLPATTPDKALVEDAAAFTEALQDLLRLYQFRDRERICCHDITVSECYALEALVRGGPQTLNQVAATLRLDKSTASRVIRSLEEKAYVKRTAHPEDGRAVQLVPSASGERLFNRIHQELEDRYRGMLAGFDARTRQAVLAVIRRLQGDAACGLGGSDCC